MVETMQLFPVHGSSPRVTPACETLPHVSVVEAAAAQEIRHPARFIGAAAPAPRHFSVDTEQNRHRIEDGMHCHSSCLYSSHPARSRTMFNLFTGSSKDCSGISRR